jgi:hypothetical protein
MDPISRRQTLAATAAGKVLTATTIERAVRAVPVQAGRRRIWTTGDKGALGDNVSYHDPKDVGETPISTSRSTATARK